MVVFIVLKHDWDSHDDTQVSKEFKMSLHKSLKGSTSIQVRRNVMKRFERIDQMVKEGKWKEGDKVLGLPKTKSLD